MAVVAAVLALLVAASLGCLLALFALLWVVSMFVFDDLWEARRTNRSVVNFETFDISVMSADGSGTPTNLTNNATDDIGPDYSPDGKKVVYDKLPTGNYSGTPY
jgi:UDP-N-acetylmuramyl pentapeptide phosphotransferase/UDP-N-acetylglucosamine-1-phosphate transferase